MPAWPLSHFRIGLSRRRRFGITGAGLWKCREPRLGPLLRMLGAGFDLAAAVAQHFFCVSNGSAVKIARVFREKVDDVAKLVQKRDHLRGQRIAHIISHGEEPRALRLYRACFSTYL